MNAWSVHRLFNPELSRRILLGAYIHCVGVVLSLFEPTRLRVDVTIPLNQRHSHVTHPLQTPTLLTTHSCTGSCKQGSDDVITQYIHAAALMDHVRNAFTTAMGQAIPHRAVARPGLFFIPIVCLLCTSLHSACLMRVLSVEVEYTNAKPSLTMQQPSQQQP